MPSEHMGWNIEFCANCSHLILKKFPERFKQFKRHVRWKPTDVMVRFNRGRRSLDRDTLDDIGIERPLCKKTEVMLHVCYRALESLNELYANDFSLLLWICDTR